MISVCGMRCSCTSPTRSTVTGASRIDSSMRLAETMTSPPWSTAGCSVTRSSEAGALSVTRCVWKPVNVKTSVRGPPEKSTGSEKRPCASVARPTNVPSMTTLTPGSGCAPSVTRPETVPCVWAWAGAKKTPSASATTARKKRSGMGANRKDYNEEAPPQEGPGGRRNPRKRFPVKMV